MFGQLTWYLARSAGLLAWALVTASVVWGLLLSSKAGVLGRRPRPAWLLDLHRYLGGLATIFTLVHVVALVADSYVHFDVVSVLVPFASEWRPGAVAWGVVGLWLLLAVELTSLARKCLPRRAWRLVHGASFPLFVVATVHGLTAGTDTGSLAFVVTAAVAILAVAGLTALRIDQARRSRPSVRPAPVRSSAPPPPAAPVPVCVAAADGWPAWPTRGDGCGGVEVEHGDRVLLDVDVVEGEIAVADPAVGGFCALNGRAESRNRDRAALVSKVVWETQGGARPSRPGRAETLGG